MKYDVLLVHAPSVYDFRDRDDILFAYLSNSALHKKIHPNAKTMVGGIASTFYHDELIRYPQVDYVVRGYRYADARRASREIRDPKVLAEIPNLELEGRRRSSQQRDDVRAGRLQRRRGLGKGLFRRPPAATRSP